MNAPAFQTDRLPFQAVVILSLVIGLAALAWLVPSGEFVTTMTLILGDVGLAGLIFLAAGGWGDWILSRWVPKDTPRGLRIVSGFALGLYLFSMLMLALGSLGMMASWLYWVVIAGGIGVMLIRGRQSMDQLEFPSQVSTRAMVWLVLALIAAVWFAGLARPAGEPGIAYLSGYSPATSLDQTLQLPREYFENGRITTLDHNVASYAPQNMEMLTLMGMALRANAWSGMYVAKAIHGLMGVLAVAAVFTGLQGSRFRSAAAGAMLASTPLVIFAGWVASSELAQVLYLTLAVLWLARWLPSRSWRDALPIGLALGACVGVAYASVAVVILPVLAMMVLSSLRQPKALLPVLGVVALTLAMACPWLIRNTLAAGNPVFPLATATLGAPESWSDEAQTRWDAGHALTPEPQLPGLSETLNRHPVTRTELLYRHLLLHSQFGPVTLLLAGLGICLLVADRNRPAWDWMLVGLAITQIALWAALCSQMRDVAILPAIVPLAILAAGLIDRLSHITTNPFRKQSDTTPTPWGQTASRIIISIAVLVNVAIAAQGTRATRGVATLNAATISAHMVFTWYDLGEAPQLLLVGERKVFYFPAGSLYAGLYDTHPMERIAAEHPTPEAMLAELKARGVTHIWINWTDVDQRMIYPGFPSLLSPADPSLLITEEGNDLPRPKPSLAVFEAMVPLGLTELDPTAIPQEDWTEDVRNTVEAHRQAMQQNFTVYALPSHEPGHEPTETIDTAEQEGDDSNPDSTP